MSLARRVKPSTALCALTSALHVLVYTEYMMAAATKYGLLCSLGPRPSFGIVRFQSIMTAYARIEFPATCVLDGNDVER